MRISSRILALVLAAFSFGATAGLSVAAECGQDVRDPKLKRLNCHVDAAAEGEVAEEVRKATAGLIDSYDCAFDLDIPLQALDEGRAKSLAVSVPGQGFKCKIKTVAGELNPSGKVSATVASEGGKVTDVKMSLDETAGLKGFVAKTLKLLLGSKKVRSEAAEAVEQILAERAAKR